MSAMIRKNPYFFAVPLTVVILLAAFFLVRTAVPEGGEDENPNRILGAETVTVGQPVDLIALFVDETVEQEQPEDGASQELYASYEWDLGDGNPSATTFSTVNSATFAEPGTYLITAARRGFAEPPTEGAQPQAVQVTRTFSISVTEDETTQDEQDGALVLSSSPSSPQVGQNVTFSLQLTSLPQELQNVVWSPKAYMLNVDGHGWQTSSDPSFQMQFTQLGDHTARGAFVGYPSLGPNVFALLVRIESNLVTIKVRDDGDAGSGTQEGDHIVIDAQPRSAEVGEKITLTAILSQELTDLLAEREADMVNYRWELGDDMPIGKSRVIEPCLAPGEYSVRVHLYAAPRWTMLARLLHDSDIIIKRTSPPVTVTVRPANSPGVSIIVPEDPEPRILIGRGNVWQASIFPSTSGQWAWDGHGGQAIDTNVVGDVSTITFLGQLPQPQGSTGPSRTIRAIFTPDGATDIPPARLRDLRRASYFGVDLAIGMGQQDDAIQINGNTVTFLVRAGVDVLDSSSAPLTGPAETGSKVQWALTSGLARFGPQLSHVFDGEAFTTVTMPAVSGYKARLNGKVTKLMAGGDEVFWGPPDPAGADFEHADYEKPSPEVRFYKPSRIDLDCQDGAAGHLFSLNGVLGITDGLGTAKVTVRNVEGQGLAQVKDSQGTEVLVSADQTALVDLSSSIATGTSRSCSRASSPATPPTTSSTFPAPSRPSSYSRSGSRMGLQEVAEEVAEEVERTRISRSRSLSLRPPSCSPAPRSSSAGSPNPRA